MELAKSQYIAIAIIVLLAIIIYILFRLCDVIASIISLILKILIIISFVYIGLKYCLEEESFDSFIENIRFYTSEIEFGLNVDIRKIDAGYWTDLFGKYKKLISFFL